VGGWDAATPHCDQKKPKKLRTPASHIPRIAADPWRLEKYDSRVAAAAAWRDVYNIGEQQANLDHNLVLAARSGSGLCAGDR